MKFIIGIDVDPDIDDDEQQEFAESFKKFIEEEIFEPSPIVFQSTAEGFDFTVESVACAVNDD